MTGTHTHNVAGCRGDAQAQGEKRRGAFCSVTNGILIGGRRGPPRLVETAAGSHGPDLGRVGTSCHEG